MLERKVEAFLQRKGFRINHRGIVVGVSGGPDSLALLHFLWNQRAKWNVNVVAAHVDHMFRGSESEEEAYFVKDFCEKRNIPFEMRQINIPNFMKETGRSSQTAAREARYAFFREVLSKYKYSLLALGHHGDDQIETILMRLTRGSTGKARAGIPFTRKFHQGDIVRPFLCLNREEIEEYCSYHQLNPRRDPSNDKDVYSRNRFRKYVLPFLRTENPQVHEHFQRLSEDIESDENYLDQLAFDEMKNVISKKYDNRLTIDIDAFVMMPLPLQRRGIQLILNYLYKVRPSSLSALHIDNIFSLLASPHPSGSLDLPSGLKVVRSYYDCHFQFNGPVNDRSYQLELITPGETILPTGDKLILELRDKEKELTQHTDSFHIYIGEEHLPLRVRTRKDGDRMMVAGMSGTKKVKKIFIDEKIPLDQRETWPIVTNCLDEIIWIPGLRKSRLYQEQHSNHQQGLFLTYKRADSD